MMVTNILGKQSLQMAFIQRNNVVLSTRKTSGEFDLWAALQCGIRIETAREPTTQSLLLSIPVMVPMSCLHFISRSFGGAKD